MSIKFKIMLVTISETKNNSKLIMLIKETTTTLHNKFYLTIDKKKLMDYLNGYLSLLELKQLTMFPN